MEIMLKNLDLESTTDFLFTPYEKLSNKISKRNWETLREYLINSKSIYPKNLYDVYLGIFSTNNILSTGLIELNNLLDGGIYSGEILEIIGKPCTGKTHLVLSIASNIASSTNVLFISTNNNFSSITLRNILNEKNVLHKDTMEILEKIACVNIHDIYDLLNYFSNLMITLSLGHNTYFKHMKLIIIDTFLKPSYEIFKENSIEGMCLNIHLKRAIKEIASHYNISFILTNDISFYSKNVIYKEILRDINNKITMENIGSHKKITLIKSHRNLLGTTITI